MRIEDVVEKFNTTPFFFWGSGITRRYFNLPDWKGLLSHFAKEIRDDDLAYSFYENRANKENNPEGLFPKVAELIQNDYEEKWFENAALRHIDDEGLEMVKNGVSPFKAEISQYIKENSVINEAYREEIDMVSSLAVKNIAGVITTNYDTFIEDHFKGYAKYVGQKQLIFSTIQEVAEIYKIHGSVENPESIVINEKDYKDFAANSEYLAAKLMTIFMEYPIIFMGYSISDSNVQRIIKSIVNCLDEKQVNLLENRFVFVEYQKGKVGATVTPYTIMIDDKPLTMTKIEIDDFKLLYRALEGKKAKLPVKVLRRFKQELYDFTVTSTPTSHMRVAGIDDQRVADEELVMAIGKYSDLGLKGLKGLKADEWYRNIVLNDIEFTADDLLMYSFPDLIKQNSGRLPLNKYLSEATQSFPECIKAAEKQDFDFLISATIKKNRKKLGDYKSVAQIWQNEKQSLLKATDLIAHLEEDQFDVKELEMVLNEIFDNDVNVLQGSLKTNVRRLIRIYDYLKWGKNKEPLDGST